MKYQNIGIAVLLLIICSFLGCAEKRPDGMPKLYPVKITIVQDEKPLVEAMVALMPMEEENGRWASGGQTNSYGVADVRVQGVYLGAAPGKYKVCITKMETDPVVPTSPDQISPIPNSYDLIEPKYGNMETAQEVEVVANSKNAWTIDVGKAVRKLIPKR